MVISHFLWDAVHPDEHFPSFSSVTPSTCLESTHSRAQAAFNIPCNVIHLSGSTLTLHINTGNVRITQQRRVRVTTVVVEKHKYYILLMCVCSLRVSNMQCACAILPSVVCPVLQNFSTLSHKRYDFLKNVIEYKFVC
jgi:hypothetical protein